MIKLGTFKALRAKDWTAKTAAADDYTKLEVAARDFYRDVLFRLQKENVPFLVGGAYAFATYTGVVRHTKDLDIFTRASDCERVLDVAAAAGWKTELTFRHWLAKIFSSNNDLVDVIYGSGNGLCEVDDDWFRYAPPANVLNVPVHLVPVEEMIWSKGYILERERYDGADIAHLLRGQGSRLDWQRLLARFGEHWRLLFSHMVLFGFIYPGEQDRIPRAVMDDMLTLLAQENGDPPSQQQLCRGTLLSHTHFKIDVEEWGYRDARLAPMGNMTEEDIRQWSSAFK